MAMDGCGCALVLLISVVCAVSWATHPLHIKRLRKCIVYEVLFIILSCLDCLQLGGEEWQFLGLASEV